MDVANIVWLIPLIVLVYVLLFAQYLKRQDQPPAEKQRQTPAE